ncbi:2Fe-2S iron-sulfur cluster binding domain-containing protein [Azospirillum sp. INR13]|uniref:2Fe-2S iron-sulfur cluster-binding protein n=1 Tax=Azospirillum sp. INR13 TaxID=2596919 RepID=UPI001892382A|nr:2Fe-2S iron-sulfur cluster-binding protein [Azospirillum sp. INR13]MBF5096518.1 2Fe-2S iron-sulfur cluster binding domain-containing protein [Azospirillum sp. INR13]
MVSVTYIEHDGTEHRVDATPGRSLMQTAKDKGIPGIYGDCNGGCTCGTCHCFIDERFATALPPPLETEAAMLDANPDRQPNSRLACQIRLNESLDGITVTLPAEQF